MDELIVRLGVKLVVFCVLFTGLSVAAKAARGRPGPTGKRPPPDWPDLPDPEKPAPSGTHDADRVMGERHELTARELDRLCEERARIQQARSSPVRLRADTGDVS